MLDLSQDGFDILSHSALAQTDVDNRNHRGRDFVGKVSPSYDRFGRLFGTLAPCIGVFSLASSPTLASMQRPGL